MKNFAIELTAAIDAAATTQKIYLSDRQFITSPSDTPANTAFEPRLLDPGSFSRQAYTDGKTGGAVKVGLGEIVVANADGGLDDWIDYAFAGRNLVIRYGDVGDAYPGGWATLFTGTVQSLEADFDELTVRSADRLILLDKPVLTAFYAGNNALPAGLEGVAGDLKGRAKPRIYGTALNIAPPLVNTSNLVYGLSDHGALPWANVYDRGVPLTFGVYLRLAPMTAGTATVNFTVNTTTDVLTTSSAHGYTTGDPVTVASTTTLPAPLVATGHYYARSTGASTLTLHPLDTDAINDTNRINITSVGSGTHNISNNRTLAGKYDKLKASDLANGGYIRLGTSPTGLVTCNATTWGPAGVSFYYTGEAMGYLAADADDLSLFDHDFGPISAASSAQVGVYITDSGVTFLTTMEQLAATIGAWFGFAEFGVLRGDQLTAPSGPAAVRLTEDDMLSIERRTPDDLAIPTWKVTVLHSRLYTLQPTDLAASVTAVRRAELVNEYRRESAEDASIKTQWMTSSEMEVVSCFADDAGGFTDSATAAAAEAARRLALYKVKRDIFDVTIPLDTFLSATVTMMSVVTLVLGRFGLDAGRDTRVIGINYELAERQVTLSLWG